MSIIPAWKPINLKAISMEFGLVLSITTIEYYSSFYLPQMETKKKYFC
jgi:hypothetical protein